MAVFKKGHIMSPEMRAKISATLKGLKRSPETLVRMSIAQKINAKKFTKEHRRKQALAITGRKASPETRAKMSAMRQKEFHPHWKGGITPVLLQIRHCFKTRQWISDCFTRDNFICQKCFERGGKLVVHHIKFFSKIIEENGIKSLDEALVCEELWNLNNGQTLCRECHRQTHLKNGKQTKRA